MAHDDLHAAAFPRLTPEQLDGLTQCAAGSARHYQNGQILFRVGDCSFKFFVVKSGRVKIIDPSGEQPKIVTIHEPGEFTGDVSHLTGNPSVVTAIADGDCLLYEISNEDLHQVLNRCPDLSDLILQAFIARRQLLRASGRYTGLRIIGSRYSQDTFRIRDFLARNRVLFTWLDLEADPEVDRLLRHFGVTPSDTPVVICGQLVLLRNPSNRELAEAIGIRRPIEAALYDLAIVGAGPAGLAAAVYGASEGLCTLVLDKAGPGGQAGASMRIENYMGFPTGVTGAELTDRAVIQANKFGAQLSIPSAVRSLRFESTYPVLQLDGGESLTARCLLIATGAEYRRLDVPGCHRFEGRGVYYAATMNEESLCRGADVAVVGGGNSAGQATVFLAGRARRVYLLMRGNDLYKNMSSYLAQRIEQTSNIEILRSTEVRQMIGNSHLHALEIVNNRMGQAQHLEVAALFSFIGAVPRTDWLPPEIERDSRGFVLTGPALRHSAYWKLPRDPFLLETSHPGVFAAGDIRSSSIKRVASAVGEGSMAVQFVHQYLKEI